MRTEPHKGLFREYYTYNIKSNLFVKSEDI